MEEVRDAVFELGKDKALGPNNFPIAFFQHFWSEVKVEVMAFLQEFHLRGKLSMNLGASFIALIPKMIGVDKIRDFRPISLIGSVYKILAKVLASRLQKVLPLIISQNQGAFVHGPQILDGVLITNECIHSKHRDKLPGVLCKLDFEKAYDRADWSFLSYLLRRMGFGEKWRRWIQECVSTVKLSILINGSSKGFFTPTRGLC